MGKDIQNPYSGMKGYNCFGCSPDNPIGLKLTFQLEGDTVTCSWRPHSNFQGWMNVLHGGIQATVMDEIASWLVMVRLKTAGVTSKMEVKYLKPAQMNHAPFHLKAYLLEMQRNIAVVHVELSDSNGLLCAESKIHYFTWPEHIAREKLHYPGIESFLPEQ